MRRARGLPGGSPDPQYKFASWTGAYRIARPGRRRSTRRCRRFLAAGGRAIPLPGRRSPACLLAPAPGERSCLPAHVGRAPPAAVRPWISSDGSTERIRRAAIAHGVSSYAVCLAAFVATLHRLSGSERHLCAGLLRRARPPRLRSDRRAHPSPTIRRTSFEGVRTHADLLRALHRDVLAEDEHTDFQVSELSGRTGTS
jgi:hypothetical protein